MVKNIFQTHLNKTAFRINQEIDSNREQLKIKEKDIDDPTELIKKLEVRQKCIF